MPVRGGKAQKRVNEGGHNYNPDVRNSNLDHSLRQHYGFLSGSDLDPPPSLEELDELEALLEREQELLGQQPLTPPSVNLLQSPEISRRRLPIEPSHRRAHTPRTVPRTYGSISVPLNQLSAIIQNMAFSDAEEDHQGSRRDGRERSTSGGDDGGHSDRERSTSRSRTESGVSNASTVSLASPSTAPVPPPPLPVNGDIGETSSSAAGASSNASTNRSGAEGASNVNNDDLANKLLDMKGVDSKRIMEKLQQIQGYIQQTSAAMAALEQQGDLVCNSDQKGNIGQYNTLVKVMKDLKDSETKLQGHLDAALKDEKGSTESDIYLRFVTLKKSLQHQECEYMDILARSLVLSKAAAQVANGTQNEVAGSSPPTNGVEEPSPASSEPSGNQIVGIVRASNVQGLSLQERLVASQAESSAIVNRMRDSIVRREDLMTRYKATRERLENLKRQREDMRQEQQRLQESASESAPSDSNQDDPVAGAEEWPSESITTSIREFQVLFEKVVRIQDCYNLKAQSIDPKDEDAKAHIASKQEQVALKRRQLIDAITKLRRIQRQRESAGQADAGDVPSASQRNSSTAGAPNSALTPAESDSNPSGESEHPMTNESLSALGIGSQMSINEGENPEALGSAMARVQRASEEVMSKQSELACLQQKFKDMKKLLEAATTARQEDERRMIASQKRLEDAEALIAETRKARDALQVNETPEVEGAVGGDVGISGRFPHLSEIERQNPDIISKYQDLAKAKDRLAKMEEVIAMITTAKKNHQDVRDILPPDCLALLEDAEIDYPDTNRGRRQPAEVPVIEEESEDDMRASRRYLRSSRRGSANRGESSSSLGRNERYTREQENREISAMQKRLNKTTSRISAINEGSRHGHEKGAVKKQPQALWQERTSNVDPRMTEVMALQEELKQKKNALEALMRRMGKSSSFNMDNISDNISDNVSDNASDRGEGGTSATWGTVPLHDYSDNHYHQSSDDELVDADEAEAMQRSYRRSQPTASGGSKDGNRYSGSSRHRRRPEARQISVNNLTTAPATRSKHNRFRGSSVPKASWESVPSIEEHNFKSPSNTTLQAQQSIGAALSQLSQVQGTINNLHETLRHEQTQMMAPPGNLHGQMVPQMLPELPTPTLPPSSVSHIPGVGVQALTPMTAYAGLGSLSLGASGGDPNGTQMISLLQQCVSQLQLHSLEIQALSKHLQLIDRRDVSNSAPISDTGGGGRGGRGGGAARRSEGEEEEEDDEEEEDVTAGGGHPSYALHHNLLGAAISQEEREAPPQVPMSHSFPVYLGQTGDEAHPSGVTNPIYGRLGDVRDQTRAWGSHEPTPGLEQSTEHLGALMGASGIAESSPSHPLFHMDRLSEERPQSQPQAPEDHHWASLASSHPLHHQTTDLLNNQVPPGTRANNYWDNFRSYSRQNLLSTATKSNTSEHRPASCTSAAGASGVSMRHQSGESVPAEDKRFNVAVSHNNNSSSSATGGARPRVSNPRINNPKGARVRNPVSSSRQQIHGQNKHKTNNRMKQGDWYSPAPATNMPGGNFSQSAPASGVSHDRSLVNYNSIRANSSDSDGGIGSVTLEVLREAEALIRCHANQPEFLLQLFRHASQITVHTDQHVAVALLQDLAARPHRSNHGVNANSLGNNNENSSLSLPAPLRGESWRRSPCRSDHHNILPQENGSVAGLSGSEVSDSGLTSEDEDSRALYRNVKNLSLSPGAQSGIPGLLPWTSAANLGSHPPRSQFPPSPQQCHPPFPQHNYQYFPQQNISNNQGSSRSIANSESSIYDRLVYNEPQLGNNPSQEGDERWLNQEASDHAGIKSQNDPGTAGSSPEHAHHALSNDTEFLSFESLVSSAIRASVDLLQSHVGGVATTSNTVTPLLLSAILSTVVGQIQSQAQSLNLPQSFMFNVDSELKSSLQAFVGKRLMEVSNEVPSVISQVLLTQYCTVLVQRLRDNHPTLPQTPTKLPQNKQTQSSEANCEGAGASSTSTVHSLHTQENTAATQTESSVFSLLPSQHQGRSNSPSESSQRGNFQAVGLVPAATGISHNPSLPPPHSTCHPSVHTSSSTLSASPHPPHIANSLFQSSSTSGQWQGPFTVSTSLPNGPSTLADSCHDGAVGLPTSQPEAWAASSLLAQATESPVSLSRPESRSTGSAIQASGGAVQEWAEPEHEEAVMDDEPLLPVYDLAEADQSQDAGDAAEGDWEDSQAEGIQVDGASGMTDESPEHPIRLQADVEGMAECEADAAADVSGRGAMGHLLYGDHLVQGAARELGLDEVPTKLQSPDGGSPGGTPEHHSSTPQGHHSSTPEGHHHSSGQSHAAQPLHSPGGEG